MRFALGIEYDGGRFHGWQKQPRLLTVQSAVEEALTAVANHDVQVCCAGRTDTAVHATNQVVHFDSDAERSIRAWTYGTNSNLPKDVTVRWAKQVDDDFHARFSATARRYRYVIYNHPVRPAIFTGAVTWQYRTLNHEPMHEAAQLLLGERDFTSFRAIGCQSKTAMRNIMRIDVSRKNDLVILDVTANAFLHHMIRNIAGVLIAVGMGKKPIGWVKDVLEAKDRRKGAETAPPYGLYLVHVAYPEQYQLPKASLGPMFF